MDDTNKIDSPTISQTGRVENALGLSKNTQVKTDEILYYTQKIIFYNKLISEQCNRWLGAINN
jgi:hypothetical protein